MQLRQNDTRETHKELSIGYIGESNARPKNSTDDVL